MQMLTSPSLPREEGEDISIPFEWQTEVCQWATVNCKRFHYGNLLTQELKLKDFSIFIYKWLIETETLIYPTVNSGTIALQATTAGAPIPALLSGNEVALIPRRYGLFYIPAGSHTARFSIGTYESVHLELSSSWLEEISLANSSIRNLKVKFEDAAEKGVALPLQLIDYQMDHVISRIKKCREAGPDLVVEFRFLIMKALNIYRKQLANSYLEAAGLDHPYKSQLQKVRSTIISNPSNEVTLASLARSVLMSERTLSRKFQEYYGQVLQDFINKERMKKARFLVRDTTVSFIEITIELGYANPDGFYKAYKNAYGITPKQDREGDVDNDIERLSSDNE